MEVVRSKERDPYKSYRKVFSECIVKPFLMGMAGALGLSVGYAMFDRMASGTSALASLTFTATSSVLASATRSASKLRTTLGGSAPAASTPSA